MTLLYLGVAGAQHPAMDMAAEKIVQKYQSSTCDQLLEKRSQPKSPREQQMVQMLRDNPQLRTEFINKVAAPIANKMFECGMIP
jgi:hypothetical protein